MPSLLACRYVCASYHSGSIRLIEHFQYHDFEQESFLIIILLFTLTSNLHVQVNLIKRSIRVCDDVSLIITAKQLTKSLLFWFPPEPCSPVFLCCRRHCIWTGPLGNAFGW